MIFSVLSLRTLVSSTPILLTDAHLIAACAKLGSQLDGVPNVKGVNFAKVIVDAPIMARNRHIASQMEVLANGPRPCGARCCPFPDIP